jgi:hypothetical protein
MALVPSRSKVDVEILLTACHLPGDLPSDDVPEVLNIDGHALARIAGAGRNRERDTVVYLEVALILDLILVDKYSGVVGKIFGKVPALATDKRDYSL